MKYSEIRAYKSPAPAPARHPRSALGILILLLVVMIGGVGLTHILVRNKTHAIGRQQTAVEQEMRSLEEKMRSLDMKIEESLTRKNLTDRLIQNRTMLKSILPENIVRVETHDGASP
ncbi:hypothetical protein FEM03_20250 [Phragmitibacter flavus]|uniref:Cell division protein FtsL n=1 Tax=Phragmitibacter flavus TaxID=2576071 RepID=A0A5R8KAQ6_9BACT|nr:hypothetical protein [Phragmitibacter flavus]TLD68995.1 hypothetical protein FEM03_20250 [Phragmitibacter flavus]